jgi:hypothetical protein
MAAGLPSSFDMLRKCAIALSLASLAGCAATGELMRSSDLRLFTEDQPPRIVATDSGPALKGTVAEEGKAIVIPANAPERPAWCDHLAADSAAQATIMRSPTLSGSIDDEAKSSLSLGMSLSSYMKGNLLEEAADVKCRKYIAESGIQKLIFVSPQGLTAAGYAAKAKSIGARKGQISSLRRKAGNALANGDIDREFATSIEVLADQILAEAGAAQSQAVRRLDASSAVTGNATALSRELLTAEADLEDINSRMRTLDAMDLSASVGWNDDVNDGGIEADGDSFGGKVSFSVKLGALMPKRFDHEAQAKEAKLRAISSGEGGAMWQLATLRRAHERAIAGLVEQRGKLDEAIGKAQRLSASLAEAARPEFMGQEALATLQVIKLKADRAAVDGSIAEIERNLARLGQG